MLVLITVSRNVSKGNPVQMPLLLHTQVGMCLKIQAGQNLETSPTAST